MGLVALGIASGIDGHRLWARRAVGGWGGLSADNAVRAVDLAITALDVSGATACVFHFGRNGVSLPQTEGALESE